jgi:hypothetical protein
LGLRAGVVLGVVLLVLLGVGLLARRLAGQVGCITLVVLRWRVVQTVQCRLMRRTARTHIGHKADIVSESVSSHVLISNWQLGTHLSQNIKIQISKQHRARKNKGAQQTASQQVQQATKQPTNQSTNQPADANSNQRSQAPALRLVRGITADVLQY